ncbi:MAG: hypothetical protein IT353_04430 [Gemmatimonadaceae bacterium]|nr:hypothetical protein [Gemmatimonadaceae bacterium]
MTITDLVGMTLRAAGAGMILLAFVHIPIARHLQWREESARLSPANASIFGVHAFFICLVLVLMGLPALFAPQLFLAPSTGGAWASWSYATFWAARMLAQWFVYPSHLWRGKPLETRLHVLFSVIWMALTGVFGYCGVLQLRGTATAGWG